MDRSKMKVGYEIPFTRHFYVYEPPRPRAEPCRIALHASGLPFEDIRLPGPTFRAHRAL